MYGNSTRNLPYIRNFKEADTHFTKTKPVNARKHKDRWPDNCRPLKDSSASHYQLYKHTAPNGQTYYDLVLYSTTLARYYEPVEDNGHTIETRYYKWHNSQTSKGFLWNVINISWLNEMPDMDGIKRAVPIGHTKVLDTADGTDFGARVVLRNRMLSITESDHQPLFQRRASDDDRARVRETKERLATLMDVIALRMNTFVEEAQIDYNRGRAFGGKLSYGKYNSNHLRRLVDLNVPIEEACDERSIESLYGYAQECFNVLASKRSVAMSAANGTTSYWTSRRPATNDANALDNPITAKELQASVLNGLMKDYGAKRQSARVVLPKFMPYGDFPRSNVHYY